MIFSSPQVKNILVYSTYHHDHGKLEKNRHHQHGACDPDVKIHYNQYPFSIMNPTNSMPLQYEGVKNEVWKMHAYEGSKNINTYFQVLP